MPSVSLPRLSERSFRALPGGNLLEFPQPRSCDRGASLSSSFPPRQSLGGSFAPPAMLAQSEGILQRHEKSCDFNAPLRVALTWESSRLQRGPYTGPSTWLGALSLSKGGVRGRLGWSATGPAIISMRARNRSLPVIQDHQGSSRKPRDQRRCKFTVFLPLQSKKGSGQAVVHCARLTRPF